MLFRSYQAVGERDQALKYFEQILELMPPGEYHDKAAWELKLLEAGDK